MSSGPQTSSASSSSVPWRISNRGGASQVTGGVTPQSPGPGTSSPVSTPPVSADRNMFQKCRFQFDSIGKFGRSTSRDDSLDSPPVTATTAAGQGDDGRHPVQQTTQQATGAGPTAVFYFQDFDDMVAKIRELRGQVKLFTRTLSTTNRVKFEMLFVLVTFMHHRNFTYQS